MTRFGDFETLCHRTPSYPWCNLFYRQLEHHAPLALTGLSADRSSAPVGVNPSCGTLRSGTHGSIGNVANIVACALSICVTGVLIWLCSRRKAAVGRIELRLFLIAYLLTLPLQLVTTGAFLTQGTGALAALSAVHAGAVAALFWALLGNALIATQVVEDGTLAALVPFGFFSAAFFAATTYIALDVAFSWTSVFGPSSPPASLHSIPLFVLTSIWPLVAALGYFLIMGYIVLFVLRESRPMWFYVLAGILFVLSQLDYFLLNKVICDGASAKIDGSFIATILETAAVVTLFFAWKSITEESWDDDIYYPR
ncbi:hypothetical protein FA95DRAFT_1562228 [Auriscalpium vulgare]|uniref:Uncharacterized protein n=1 Tax=Auriscalpium vulgare TaxID=40419 RepID=A0ACB8RLF0_9AGAM|nr:hypothetical protein FA95DRAFT_1562228 [Auriscalpium vulgare]